MVGKFGYTPRRSQSGGASSEAREGADGGANIRAFSASTDTRLRHGITRWLARIQDIDLVGEASDGPQMLRGVEVLQPDVVLLDTDLSGTSDTGTSSGIFQHCPEASIIMLTAAAREALLPHMEASEETGYSGGSDVLDDFLREVRTARSSEILVYRGTPHIQTPSSQDSENTRRGGHLPTGGPVARIAVRLALLLSAVVMTLAFSKVLNSLFPSIPTIYFFVVLVITGLASVGMFMKR